MCCFHLWGHRGHCPKGGGGEKACQDGLILTMTTPKTTTMAMPKWKQHISKRGFPGWLTNVVDMTLVDEYANLKTGLFCFCCWCECWGCADDRLEAWRQIENSFARLCTVCSLGFAFPLLVLLKQGKKPITNFKNIAAGDVVFAFNANHWPFHY